MYANDRPGWGVELNETAAAKFPYKSAGGSRGKRRGGWMAASSGRDEWLRGISFKARELYSFTSYTNDLLT